jgi:hypothetical protein
VEATARPIVAGTVPDSSSKLLSSERFTVPEAYAPLLDRLVTEHGGA